MGETDTTEPNGILSQNHTICGVCSPVWIPFVWKIVAVQFTCAAAPHGRPTMTATACGNTDGLIP